MKIGVFHNLGSGAAKRSLYDLVRTWRATGHEVEAFLPADAAEDFLSLAAAGAKVTTFPLRKTWWGVIKSAVKYQLPLTPSRIPPSDIDAMHRGIAAAIDRRHLDIVYLEQDRETFTPFLVRYLMTPHVYFCAQPYRWGERVVDAWRRRAGGQWRRRWSAKVKRAYAPLIGRLDADLAQAATYLVTNSYFTAEAILRRYGRYAHVSYLGVDVDFFRPLGYDREAMALSVGAVIPAKGYDFLIAALGQLPASVRPSLTIVGNVSHGDYRAYLEYQAEQQGVALTLLENIKNKELRELYNRAKLCLYAPYLEPFGLVPLEAMACGTPVVAVREGGIRESLKEGHGALLTEREVAEFAAAIHELLTKPEKYRNLARETRAYVEGFWTLEQAGERMRRHLERAARGPQGKACQPQITNEGGKMRGGKG